MSNSLTLTASERRAVELAVANKEMNDIDRMMLQLPQLDLPMNHLFTPGLYVRECFVPKNTLVTSKIHRTHHPFIISLGRAAIWTSESGVIHVQAPHTGITAPGTRRFIYTYEDTVWSTFHPTEETDLQKLESILYEPHPEELRILKKKASTMQKELQCTT